MTSSAKISPLFVAGAAVWLAMVPGCSIPEHLQPVLTLYSQQVSVGLATTCLRDATNQAVCYGSEVGRWTTNQFVNTDPYVPDGVGMGSTTSFPPPHSLGPILNVSAGAPAVCAVLSDGIGRVACWGFQGIVGNYQQPVGPVLVPGLSGAKLVSVGEGEACSVSTAGDVWCWGLNDQRSTPDEPAATGLSDVVQLSVGGVGRHSCAVKSDHSVWCWGANQYGQLGRGFVSGNSSDMLQPGVVPGLAVTKVSVGVTHTCALQVDGVVSCWGWNTEGEIGVPKNGIAQSIPSPRVIDGAQGARDIAAGWEYSCAVMQDGGLVKCWGSNTFGTLGVGGSAPSTNIPTVIPGLSEMVSVSAGSYHTCVAGRITILKCWGGNGSGQLADGTTKSSAVPVPM